MASRVFKTKQVAQLVCVEPELVLRYEVSFQATQ